MRILKSFLKISLVCSFLVSANSVTYGETIPRPEYPRPQFERADWINLNGEWSYIFDTGKSGLERGYQMSEGFQEKIIVPYCPESKLSGVGYTDFIEAMWYQRQIKVPQSWKGKKIILNFGAVDFYSKLFIDGKFVGQHWGGSSSFCYDITKYIDFDKTQNIVLYVMDDVRSQTQPAGKQSRPYKSAGCSYTRTTGIWQTVWLEAVAQSGMEFCKITPDLDNNRFIFQPVFHALENGLKFRVKIMDAGKTVGQEECVAANNIPTIVSLKKPKTWSPESPFLYDIVYQVINKKGEIIDEVKSYAGLRKIHIEGNNLYLNNSPVYLRFVLDQGFYPDGVWTAPTDKDLKRDIELSMNAGFNGARLHQKIFEERFHYWADKLGYLTWSESANWGGDANSIEMARNFISEWEEIVTRDMNHPSIIAWTPFNETWERNPENPQQHDRLLTDIYYLTKTLDPTRPVNQASGGFQTKTDLYAVHTYEQNPKKLKELLAPKAGNQLYVYHPEYQVEYEGQPYYVDEYGGIKWVAGSAFADNSWGYGDAPKTEQELYERMEKLTDAILDYDFISGYCYTQLTDVEQEQNGIYNYDRSEKFDMNKVKKIFSKTPETLKKQSDKKK